MFDFETSDELFFLNFSRRIHFWSYLTRLSFVFCFKSVIVLYQNEKIMIFVSVLLLKPLIEQIISIFFDSTRLLRSLTNILSAITTYSSDFFAYLLHYVRLVQFQLEKNLLLPDNFFNYVLSNESFKSKIIFL